MPVERCEIRLALSALVALLSLPASARRAGELRCPARDAEWAILAEQEPLQSSGVKLGLLRTTGALGRRSRRPSSAEEGDGTAARPAASTDTSRTGSRRRRAILVRPWLAFRAGVQTGGPQHRNGRAEEDSAAGGAQGPGRRRYNVGFRLLRLPREGKPPLVVALWYPTEAKPKLLTYAPALRQLQGEVARDAIPAKGPFPLVVFSHGGIGAGIAAMAWAEALAAEGFVVAAPDHHDRVVLLRSDLEQPPGRRQIVEALRWAMTLSRRRQTGRVERSEYEHRPKEIAAVIDALLQTGNQSPAASFQQARETWPPHGLVAPDRIGLTGVSFGSWTTAAVAGGIGWYHDRRIRAAIRMAPSARKVNVARIKVPLMTIFGEKETVVLLDKRPDARLKEDAIKAEYKRANPPKFLVGIKGAEHLDFDADGMTTRGSLRRREPTRVYTTAEVRHSDPVIRTIVRYQLAFWRRYLLGDRSAQRRLTTFDKADVYVFQADLGPGGTEP